MIKTNGGIKMTEQPKKTEQKPIEHKEGFIKKSFTYPEAPQNQERPAGAEVQQPPVKQAKKC